MNSSTMSDDSMLTDPGHRAVVAQSDERGVFVITAGERVGRVFSFVRQGLAIAMGRGPECTARFDSQSISRLHARAVWIGDRFMIADAGSTNGTFVNDRRVTFSTTLQTGDQVRLGPELTMRFAVMDPEEERALILASEADHRDPVTGVVGRGYLEHVLNAEIRCARRKGEPLSVMKIEMDQLETINQSHGPLVVDELLAGLARIIRARTPNSDVLGCDDDGQFLLIEPATPLEEARAVAEHLRREVAGTTLRSRSESFALTVSIGIASTSCCSVDVDRLSLLFIADQRIYLARRTRNVVVSSGGCVSGSLRAGLGDESTLAGQ